MGVFLLVACISMLDVLCGVYELNIWCEGLFFWCAWIMAF